MKRTQTVDEYIQAHSGWKASLDTIRRVMLSANLAETIKWNGPVYTLGDKNIAGIGAFKNFVSVWFFQGAFLSDRKGVLVNAQEGKTQAMRQWRFGPGEPVDTEGLREYLLEAIQNQMEGREVKPERKKPLLIPEELTKALDANPEAKACFEELTPGKKREYAEYILEVKRPDTRQKRLEKIIPQILERRGLNDKYR